jgi:hypothetical protein
VVLSVRKKLPSLGAGRLLFVFFFCAVSRSKKVCAGEREYSLLPERNAKNVDGSGEEKTTMASGISKPDASSLRLGPISCWVNKYDGESRFWIHYDKTSKFALRKKPLRKSENPGEFLRF